MEISGTELDKGTTTDKNKKIKKSRRDKGLDKDGETESKNDGQCGG